MICNFTSGNEFIGVVNYANRDDRTTKARVIASEGVCTVTNQSIADSFVIQALMRPDAKEPVRHISISFHPDDAPKFPETEKGDEFMTQIVMDWMEAMGFRNTQFLLVRHHDHDHPHCHLVLNRVDNDGNLLNLRNDLRRNVTVCKRLKKKYGLTFGKSDGKRVNRDRLRGYDLHKYDIRMAARKAIESATTWREFRNLLAKEGVKLHVAFSKDGQVNGVSYQLGDFRITGSKLDKHLFTYGKLVERFGNLAEETRKEAASQYAGIRSKAKEAGVSLPKFSEVFPDGDPPAQVAIQDSPESTDDEGNLHLELGLLMDLLLQPYCDQFPSYAGTDTSLDEFRRREREQKKESQTFKRRK